MKEFIKKKISKTLKNKIKNNEKKSYFKKGCIPWNKGLKNCYSEETKKKMSENNGKYWKGKKIPKDIINKRIESMKINPNFGMRNKTHTKETKKKMSESSKGEKHPLYGKHHSKESRKKMSLSKKGKIIPLKVRKRISKGLKGIKRPKWTDNRKRKLRILKQKYFKELGPREGKNERKILNLIEEEFNYKIIRQFPICGYFVDGYILELNLVIEIDEKAHKKNKQKDLQRQKEIEEELNCKFMRIKDYD